jgi:hypothetical protein
MHEKEGLQRFTGLYSSSYRFHNRLFVLFPVFEIPYRPIVPSTADIRDEMAGIEDFAYFRSHHFVDDALLHVYHHSSGFQVLNHLPYGELNRIGVSCINIPEKT